MKKQLDRKILYTPQRGIGDLIHSLPLIHSLKEAYPEHELVIPIVDGQQERASFFLNPLIKRLVTFSYRPLRKDIDAERHTLYRGEGLKDRFKIDYEKRRIFEKKLYETYLKGESYFLAIVPRSFNIGTISCNQQFTLNDLVYQKGLHVVDRSLKFADALGIRRILKFDLSVSWQDQVVDSFNRKVNLPKNYVVLLLSSGRTSKKWTVEGFRALVKYCKERNCNPILIGSEREYEDSKKIEQSGVLNLTHEEKNLIDLENFAKITKNAIAVIGSDTGLTHIADATGTKVIGLYGPTRPSKFAPYNNRNLVISTNNATGLMSDIEPEEVMSKLEQVLIDTT